MDSIAHEQGAPESMQTLDLAPRAPGFTLLRRFTVLSLGTTLVISAIFGVITSHFVEDFALRRQVHATADHVLEFAGARLLKQDLLLPPLAKKPRLDRTMRALVGTAGIVHLTVWNRQGTVMFRDDPKWPDGTVPQSPQFPHALAGQLQWRQIDSSGLPRLEVFIPVLVAGSSRPIAIYQVLYDSTALAPALARLKWSVEMSVVLGVLSLYAVLFSIVRKASRDLERHQSLLRRNFVGMIQSLINALDARDMATAHHSSRVAEMAVAIARVMALSATEIREIEVAAFLHDVGKIGIRDDVLAKRGPLNAEEKAIMQRHAEFGYEILSPVPLTDGIKLGVRHSHERWDGQGYPDGLAGEQIPLAARIVAVADAYEALTNNRPYRIAQSAQTAIEELRRCSGSQFDPQVVRAFLQVWYQGKAIEAGRENWMSSPTLTQDQPREAKARKGGASVA